MTKDNVQEVDFKNVPDESTINELESLLGMAKAGDIRGICYVRVGDDDMGYGMTGEAIASGLQVLGMLRMIEHKLMGLYDEVLDTFEVNDRS